MNHIKSWFIFFNSICKYINLKFIHLSNEQGHPRANVQDL